MRIRVGHVSYSHTKEAEALALALQSAFKKAIPGVLTYWYESDKYGGDIWIIRRPPSREEIQEALLRGFDRHVTNEHKRRRLKEAVENIFDNQPPLSPIGMLPSALEDILCLNLHHAVEDASIEFASPIYECLGINFREEGTYRTAFDRVFNDKGELQKEAVPRRILVRQLRAGVVEKLVKPPSGNKPNVTKTVFTLAVNQLENPTRAKVAEALGVSERYLTQWCKANFPSSEGKHFPRAVKECRKQSG